MNKIQISDNSVTIEGLTEKLEYSLKVSAKQIYSEPIEQSIDLLPCVTDVEHKCVMCGKQFSCKTNLSRHQDTSCMNGRIEWRRERHRRKKIHDNE